MKPSTIGTPDPALTCACGRRYSLAEWLKLPLLGFMDLEEEGDRRAELRLCSACGSSRGRALPAVPRCMPCGEYRVARFDLTPFGLGSSKAVAS